MRIPMNTIVRFVLFIRYIYVIIFYLRTVQWYVNYIVSQVKCTNGKHHKNWSYQRALLTHY